MISIYAHSSQAICGKREHQEDSCLFARAVSNAASDALPAAAGIGGAALAAEFEGTDPPTLVRHRRVIAPAPILPRAPDLVPDLAPDLANELIAVLADGMGGHVAGGRASSLACKSFVDAYLGSSGTHRQRMTKALDAANRDLALAVRADRSLEGMGCTLVAAVLGETGIRWISVGDSPLYLFRQGNLYQLNEDHSLAPVLDQLAERGEMSRQEAENHPRRHFLRSALTGSDIDIVDIADDELPLEQDDWIVLASDGIETLTHTEIANIISRNRHAKPNAMAQSLLAAVDQAGDPQQDNATVMVIRPGLADAPEMARG